MKYFAVFILLALTLTPNAFGAGRPLPPPGMPPSGPKEPKEHRHRVEGTDRTITWRRWQDMPGGDFRIRSGDRYLGHGKWQHYLVFEQSRVSVKAIKLSMIHLGSEDVREDFVIRPGSRYAIAKVTNGTMTAHKGAWSWIAQEVY
jgi:hypothetical protein